MAAALRHYARVAAIALTSLTIAGYGMLAVAQDAPAGGKVLQGLEEVTVTAQRREEAAQTVPLAITALSADMLERQQIRSIAQLDQVVPNIVMNEATGTSSASKIFLRGVGEDESFFTADTPVGIYVDDVYIARQTGAMFDLFDIERLEVLRGPQGTLYGRNTSAGAVKLVSKMPTLGEFRGQGEVTVGNYSRFDVRATGNMPIGDTVALQGAVLMRTRDGYTRNTFDGKDVNDKDVKGARLSLLAEPTDRFRALLVADYIRERSTPGYAVPLTLNALRDPLPDAVPRTGDFFVTNSDIQAPTNDLDQWGLSATLEFDATDELTLKSITSYRAMENLLYLDADADVLAPPPSITGRFHLFQDQRQYQISEELQALGKLVDGRLRYVAGLYFFRENNKQDTRSVVGLPPFIGLPIGIAGRLDLTNTAREEMTTDAYAAFVSGTYELTDKLSVTAGLRYTRESKEFSNNVLLPNGSQQVVCINSTGAAPVQAAAAPCTPAQVGLGFFNYTNASTFDRTWDDTTPRVVLDYKLTDRALAYISAAKGFKGGTTSGRDTAALRNLLRIVGDPETNWSYEVGIKADWLDRRLRTNAAVFRNEYAGLQFGVTTPDGGFGRINAGDAKIDGFELEVTAVPIEGLELNASVGLLDSEYTKWTAALSTCTAQRGLTTVEQYLALPLKQAPDWSYRVGANYSHDLGQRGVVSVGADYSAKDDHYNNLCGTEGIRVTDYEFVNAQLRWESAAGNTLVTLAGNNLTDAEVFNGGFDFGRSLGFAAGFLYAPRTWSLSLRYDF
ncbi:MAG: TonB-dependent receptor [Proteobacteria bacterium]|nr:TonB-dependent receptor [Pseudomonadota bacterium]